MTEGASKTKRGERIRTPLSNSRVSATRRHTRAKAFGAVTRLNGSYEALSKRTLLPFIIQKRLKWVWQDSNLHPLSGRSLAGINAPVNLTVACQSLMKESQQALRSSRVERRPQVQNH